MKNSQLLAPDKNGGVRWRDRLYRGKQKERGKGKERKEKESRGKKRNENM